ncbi:MAG: glycosyl hydrolase [Bacteroidia bacterium]|nr:glycosyl hydrolase [Bacteroidia bacterium]
MKYLQKSVRFVFIAVLFPISTGLMFSQTKPVSPKSSPEAVALLDFFYSISGKYILTGQHNYPNVKDRNTCFASEYIGKTPVVFTTDWGFAKENDKDSYLARPQIVKEAIRQHILGSIISICWHAVPPTAKEPITFQPVPGANPPALESVQGQLTDQQFKDILNPGTALYKSWCTQVDSVAHYLKLLQDAHVPVLWRPYHEMNGSWFWWGGRTGKYSTQSLYRQLFNRLTKIHKLNNLIWEWSVDRPNRPEMKFSNFYPGNEYLDIVALDVYGSDFNQAYYDSLVVLSKGKPLVLAEVGNPPSLDILSKQPKWGYYAVWAGMVRNTLKKQYKILTADPRVLCLEDAAYRKAVAPFRTACGLPQLPEIKKEPVDFSGKWVFDEDKSTLDNFGAGNLPDKMEIICNSKSLNIKKTFRQEDADDRITNEALVIGEENKSEYFSFPQITTVNRSEYGDTLFIISKATIKRVNQSVEMTTNEKWYLIDDGKEMAVNQTTASFRGKRNLVLVYTKQ